jgi:hypothetical protein
MNESENIIKNISESQSADLVKAIAVAEKMGLLNTEDDLRSILAAGLETALEEFEKVKNSFK